MSTGYVQLHIPEEFLRERETGAFDTRLWFLAFAAHVPLALLLQADPTIGAVHGLLLLAFGLYAALAGRVDRVAYTAAYLAGAEVLWRMTSSALFWEFGKYAVVILFIAAIIRNHTWRASPLALTYFAVLLPSCVMTLQVLDFDEARKQISFNLSGPLSLAISVWFFTNCRFTRQQISHLLLAFMIPLASVVTITGIATFLAGPIVFGTNSNFATSGGFGPNQVASSLGLGVLFGLLALTITPRISFAGRMLLTLVTVAFGVQSAMTFSRSGLILTLLAGMAGLLFLLRDPKARVRLVTLCVSGYLAVTYLILPALDSFTGGALVHRFESTNLSHRDDLVFADLAIWLEDPIGGSGPGVAKSVRASMTHSSSIAHTEFSRLLSDHGLFGIVAMGILFLIGARMLLAAEPGGHRAFVAVMVSWALIYMAVNGMRLVAPSLLLGLGALHWQAASFDRQFYVKEEI